MVGKSLGPGAVAAVALVVAFAFGCRAEPAADSGGALVGTDGRIAFIRATDFIAPDMESDVYTMDVDGSGERRLTDTPGLDAFPAWSPDGESIVFSSERDGNWELYLMNADGTRQRRLTHTPEEDESSPAFFRDGGKIVYATDISGASPEIHTMATDGSDRKKIAAGSFPSPSPDGERIVYTTYAAYSGVPYVAVMNADGSDQRRLDGTWVERLAGRADGEEPAWSPDGEKIAFMSANDDEDIYVMNADGSDRTRLTDDVPGNDHWPPTWSPDGTRIAFTSDGPRGSWIYAMNADGSGLTKLTGDPANAAFPAWQP